MRISALASAVAIVLAAAIGLASAADQLNTMDRVTAVPMAATDQFTTMKGVRAVPMASSELDAVKGMHVHFFPPPLIPGEDAPLIAGDVKTENNWSNEWGGSDGMPVAPSYHGLCIAVGTGAITITGSGTQCP